MLCQGRGISQDNQFHASSCNRDVHTPEVVQETDVSLLVGTYQADHDHIPFLSLKTVYRMDCNQFAERFEKSIPFDQAADILYL